MMEQLEMLLLAQPQIGINIPAVMLARFPLRVFKTESIKWKKLITGNLKKKHISSS